MNDDPAIINHVCNLEKQIVMGFWMEEYPEFSQGLNYHEVLEPLTAEQANNLVGIIKKLTQENKELKYRLEGLEK